MSRDRFAKIITLNHEVSQTLASFWLPSGFFESAFSNRKSILFFRELSQNGGFMTGVVQFMRGLVVAALLMGAAGTFHQHGGIKFKWLNQQLVGGGK